MNQVELLQKWGHLLPKVGHIPTWTEGHNLCFCAEEASKAKTMVEVGTYMGASALMMLLANPRLKLYCIDIFSQFGQQKVANYFLREHVNDGRCVLIKNNSMDAAQYIPMNIDAAFIDDGHKTDDVLRDLHALYGHVRCGGILFGHDFDKGSDVDKALVIFGKPFDVPVERMWRIIVK